MHIREARRTDFDAVRHILVACGLPDDIGGPGVYHFYLAEVNGRPVGTIGLESYPPAGLLRSAAVLPEYRGRLIGDALVREVIRKAASLGLGEIVLLTTDADAYFGHFGFVRVDRSEVTGAVRNSPQFAGAQCSGAVAMRMEPGKDG